MPLILLADDGALLGPPLAAYLQRFGMELVTTERPSGRAAERGAGAIALGPLRRRHPGRDAA